jgi:hypothetical protein
MSTKTIESFFEQLEKDPEFCSFVQKMSGQQIAEWLDANVKVDIDGAELVTRLWIHLPRKSFAEMLSFSRAWDALQLFNQGHAGGYTR